MTPRRGYAERVPLVAVVFGAVALAVGAAAVVIAVRARRRQALLDAETLARATQRIDALTGTTFDAVRYVGEAPQLVFEGDLTQVMTLERLPTVVRGADTLRAGQPGHRQALADLRGGTVFVARFSGDGDLVLEFDAGSLVIEASGQP